MTEGIFKNEKFFRRLAVLVVFLVSFSIPILISIIIQEDARNVRIKMDMGQMRDWAEVYSIENNDYKGLGTDPDIERFLGDIKDMKGNVNIFVGKNYNSYCAIVSFKKGSFCVDASGYIGRDRGICSPHVTRCN